MFGKPSKEHNMQQSIFMELHSFAKTYFIMGILISKSNRGKVLWINNFGIYAFIGGFEW